MNQLELCLESFKQELQNVNSISALEELRVKYLGKKGQVTELMGKIREIPNEQKREYGQKINQVKTEIETAISTLKEKLENEKVANEIANEKKIDITLPTNTPSGSLHPRTTLAKEIEDVFISMGFTVEDSPELDTEYNNFDAVNVAKNHPARDMQDTFYLKDFRLLRTHTSPVQVRTMLNQKPPIRMIAPGSVFRRDLDLTHTPMFHQVEGLVVEEESKVSFANLKYILEDFLRYMFGDVKVRFRPSFFPFTEPSTEVDISCIFCSGCGCRVCKQTGWLEVLGSGVVDPNVFKAVGYKNVSGYAFGLGVERFAMLLHRIPDLRSLFEGDIRLLEQFK